MRIKVKKRKKPILNPEDFEGYMSIRNPGAALYRGNTFLLVTIRYSKDRKMRMHIAKSENGRDFVLDETPFLDNDDDSIAGVEDARVNKIGKNYFITFTAFNGHDNNDDIITRIGMTKTKDFKKCSKRRILLRKFGNNKNGVLFKEGDFYYIFHRPFGKVKFPFAQIARSKDLKKFENLGTVLTVRKGKWDSARVGINTPPIKIIHPKYGECLFCMYHGANKKRNTYRMGYVILDKYNPSMVLERSNSPLIYPTLEWEKIGEVNNVVFGCGLIPLDKKRMRFYYGGADKYIGYADLTLEGAEITE